MKKVNTNLALLAIAAGLVTFNSCSSDDLYEGDQTLKEYEENFKSTFGEIDPNQDWNMATRSSVTVSVPKTTDVQIYAKNSDGVYGIVGDFQKVNGTKTLEFDIAKGTSEVLVSAANKGVIAKLGEAVDMSSAATRTWLAGSSETFSLASDYTTFTSDVVQSYTTKVPEGGDNLGEVTQNFSFVSTGPFTIYPVFWQTNSYNALGVYWTDSKGEKHEQEIYLSRKGDEVMIQSGGSAAYDEDVELNDGKTHQEGDEVTVNGQTYTISKVVDNGIQSFECNDDHTDLQVGSTCPNGHKITNIVKNDKVEVQCYNHYDIYKIGDTCPCGIEITRIENNPNAWDQQCYACGWQTSQTITVGEVCANGHTVCKVDQNYHYYRTSNIYYGYKSTYYYEKEDVHYYYTVHHDAVEGSWTSNINNTTGSGDIKSKGITINLPQGTPFGLYIKVYESSDLDNNGLPNNYASQYSFKRYSEASKNKAQAGLNPQSGYDQNSKKDGTDTSYCFASYFNTTVNGKSYTFLGFEDWAMDNTDLNDLLFVFGGEEDNSKPDVIDKGDESQFSWIIACEDLGSTDDYDFNDVVVKISSVSGSGKVSITPLAAGGTLPSYIYLNNKRLGEIHELISKDYANPNANGRYTVLNCDGGDNPGPGAIIEETVATDFSIAASNEAGATSFGGFYIKVQDTNTAESIAADETASAKTIKAPAKGDTPQMFLVKDTWKWPKESKHIEQAYPTFIDWVGNATNVNWMNSKEDDLIYQGNN